MGRYCFVDGCKSTKYKGQANQSAENVSFHGFPSDPVLREKWIQAVCVGNNQPSALQLPKYSRICIKHFSDSCIEQFGLSSRRLKPNCVPSIFPHRSEERNDSEMTTVSPVETDQSSGNTNLIDLQQESDNEIQVKEKTAETRNECTQQDGIPETPKKKPSLKSEIRYPGDVTNNRIKDMTPKTMMKSIRLLKAACARKNTLLKRLRTQQSRQKKKITSLSQLLSDLKKDCLISPDAFGM